MVKILFDLLRAGRFSGFLGLLFCRKFYSDFAPSKLLEIPLDLPPICRGFLLDFGGRESGFSGFLTLDLADFIDKIALFSSNVKKTLRR